MGQGTDPRLSVAGFGSAIEGPSVVDGQNGNRAARAPFGITLADKSFHGYY